MITILALTALTAFQTSGSQSFFQIKKAEALLSVSKPQFGILRWVNVCFKNTFLGCAQTFSQSPVQSATVSMSLLIEADNCGYSRVIKCGTERTDLRSLNGFVVCVCV